MLRMRIDAELTQQLQLGDSHSWACVGMADLTLKRIAYFEIYYSDFDFLNNSGRAFKIFLVSSDSDFARSSSTVV